jgi:hypothetical protein
VKPILILLEDIRGRQLGLSQLNLLALPFLGADCLARWTAQRRVPTTLERPAPRNGRANLLTTACQSSHGPSGRLTRDSPPPPHGNISPLGDSSSSQPAPPVRDRQVHILTHSSLQSCRMHKEEASRVAVRLDSSRSKPLEVSLRSLSQEGRSRPYGVLPASWRQPASGLLSWL